MDGWITVVAYVYLLTATNTVAYVWVEAFCLKIDFVWVQEGHRMLQPHLLGMTMFIHSGLPAWPSGFHVRFKKTTSDSAAESRRHNSAAVWKQQIKLSQVFKKSLSTNILSLHDCSDTAAGVFTHMTHMLSFEHTPQPVTLFYWPFNFSFLPLTACKQWNAHKSKIFLFFLICANNKPSLRLIQSGLKWTRQQTTHGPYLGHRGSPPVGIRWLTGSGA